jgi:proline racemase
MTAQNVSVASAPAVASAPKKLDRAAAGFGVAAGLAIIFNSLLVAATDTWPTIDAYPAQWTGHVWNSHGIADVLVFLIIGVFLTKRRFTIGGHTLALFLLLSVAIATGGFVWWVARA